LVFGNGKGLNGWLLDLDLFLPNGINIFNEENQAFFGSIIWSVMAKAKTGLWVLVFLEWLIHLDTSANRDTSLTDAWSRALSFHFLNQTTRENFFTNDSQHGANLLWSHIPDSRSFQDRLVPLPLTVAMARPGGSKQSVDLLSQDEPVYEASHLFTRLHSYFLTAHI
jgi:lysophospholipase